MRFILLLFLALQVANAQELSYSGRLVNSNGSPVTGIVDLQFDIAYSGNPAVILCSKTLTGVGLTNGLFHVNIDLTSSDCASSKEFVDIVSETPANESVVLQLTDLTNAKVYPHHAFKSVPLSIQANIARTLHSMGATTGQVLRWDGNKWSPQTFGGGVGSVTEIQTGSGLSGGPITSSGTIIIATGGVTSSHIADNTITNADINTNAGIARSKLATGAANQVVINDGAGAISSVAQLPLNLGGTGATTAAAARANLELGNVATRDVGLNTGNVLIADEVPSCLPHQKIQKSALAPYIFSCAADNDSLDATKLPLAGGTMTGPIVLDADPTLNLHAATKQYVDARSSQWITSGSNIFYSTGNVGIGMNNPSARLDIDGQIRISGGNPGVGKVLTSSVDGLATWETPTSDADNLGNHIATQNIRLESHWLSGDGGNEGIRIDSTGNVGVGTATPSSELHVRGSSNPSITISDTEVGESSEAGLFLETDGASGGLSVLSANFSNPITWADSLLLYSDNINSGGLRLHANSGNITLSNGWSPRVDRLIINPAGNVEVNGQVKINGGSPGAGKVLTSDASGLASWQTPAAGGMTALTGDVTASGSGSVTATIANDAVTTAKILDGTILDADIANSTITYSKLNLADGSIPMAKLIRMTCLPGEVITSDVTLGFRCIADNSTDTTKLPLAGGTMTGAITLAGDPTANLHAATKQYVDARASQWITSGNNIYSSNLGNVGIGTTTPSSKLEVAGGLRVANGSVAAPSISFTNKSDTGLYLGSGEQVGVVAGGNLAASFTPLDTYFYSPVYLANGTASEYAIGSTSSAGLFFPNVGSLAVSTSGQERLRVDSTGNVGIGLTNPGAKLEVAGQVKITGGAPGAGKVLTSNAAGLATWETPGSSGMTALTGDVTASGSGSVAATIADNAITSAKILDGTIGNADIANGSISFLKLNLPNGIIPISKLELLNCPAGEVITSNSPLGYRCVPDNTTDTTKLPLSGGTMTGPLILSGNPAVNLAAATKQYVDSAVSAAGSKWTESIDDIFRSTGKVGIGIATVPHAILHVDGGSRPTGFDGGDIILKTGWAGTSANRGKVSLGASAGHSAPYDLTLTTSGNSYNYQVGVPNSPGAGVSLEILASGAGSNSSHWKGGDVIISGGQTYGGSALSNIFFKTAGGGTLGTPVAPSTKMMISGTGNVGIGTTSPSAKLHVEGEVKFGNTSSTCNSANEGQQRYNSTLKVMEYCNGTRWQGYSTGISSCPSGWVMIGDAGKAATYCIQEDESTAANFWNAMSTCDAINDATLGRAHLCTLNEWYTACTRGTGLLNMKNNTEMVAQTVGSTSYLTIGGPSCETTQSDSFNGTWWYRCCIK